MGAGAVVQVIARHLQLPGIVLLLAAGVLVGPDVLGIVQPRLLGPTAMDAIVGFAVAIILFEGGMNLDARRLRAEAKSIRRLITIGALITAAGATLAAHYIMAWDWRLSTLFGTLVIVTGPTVITPLLRRIKVKHSVSTILEAEGVLIDPIGAIIAFVALELLYSNETNLVGAIGTTALVLGTGGMIGIFGGIVLALVLRRPRLVPEGLENIFVLSLVVALFQVSEVVRPESGLAAVTLAGSAVGNVRTRVTQELLEFKEQLTIMMIGLLFVLLAADVRVAGVQALGLPALATVAVLMFVVRPIQVLACTFGAKLRPRERAFIAFLAPRGIVAAAVASLFAQQLTMRGVQGGEDLRGLVFLVIAVTVTVQGLSGGMVARLLHVRRPSENGYVILGANALARTLAKLLREEQPVIVFIDSNPDRVLAAERDGFKVVFGQGLQARVLGRAELASRLGAIGLTPNEEVNLLFANKVRAETRAPSVWVALRQGHRSVQAENVHEARARTLFGRGQPLDVWSERLEEGTATLERWRCEGAGELSDAQAPDVDERGTLLMLTVRRRNRVRPVDDEERPRTKDEVDVLIAEEHRAAAMAWLELRGYVPVLQPGRVLADQSA
jgi:NhaP-type Na+/H+ or K+/H+ antiporter